MAVQKLHISLLPQGEGYDCRDAGGRAKQEARAEDEGGLKSVSYHPTDPLTPALSLRERVFLDGH